MSTVPHHSAEPVRRIRARYTERTVTVYQAYAPELGLPAARDGGSRWRGSGSGWTWIKQARSQPDSRPA